MLQQTISEFTQAWLGGSLCLHPTDTLPGLSFNPSHPQGKEALAHFKGRPQEKPFVSLVSSLELALSLWEPLPGCWQEALELLWPGPLSVVWLASSNAPASLVSDQGTIGLRHPALPNDRAWMQQLLEELGSPLPTTSVNKSGEAPIATWEEAVVTLQNEGVYCPKPEITPRFEVDAQPSTLIALQKEGPYSILRQGALSTVDISKCFARVTKHP